MGYVFICLVSMGKAFAANGETLVNCWKRRANQVDPGYRTLVSPLNFFKLLEFFATRTNVKAKEE